MKKNGIQHRWEFLKGISFYYKDKRFKLGSLQDLEKFTRRYEKELDRKGEIKERPGGKGQKGPRGPGRGRRGRRRKRRRKIRRRKSQQEPTSLKEGH